MPFLIEGRTYRCREAGLTATVSKNEDGWWIATYSDGVQGTISDKGYFLTVKESTRDLIAMLPEVKNCECCGQVVKELSWELTYKKEEKLDMQLYILRPVKPWEPWYDKCFGMVVRAENEQLARTLVTEEAGDEGADVWLDNTQTTCEVLNTDGKPMIIIRDFAAA